MQHKTASAKWYLHVNAVNPSPQVREWLTDRRSLTSKLIEHSRHFRVQRLQQKLARCLMDECDVVGLPHRRLVQEREVLLRCDEVPVVFAHTIVPLSATAADWPFFSSLGERSLGTTLFGDPLVSRGKLQYARLHATHPLSQRACAAARLHLNGASLFARRCLFRRKNGLLLVTEVFLPTLLNKQNDR